MTKYKNVLPRIVSWKEFEKLKVSDFVKQYRVQGEGIKVPVLDLDGEQGYIYFRISSPRKKYVSVVVDLWGVSYDLSDAGKDFFQKQYQDYVKKMFEHGRKKVLYYSPRPTTHISFEVEKGDEIFWLGEVLHLISIPSFITSIKPVAKKN
jgi:hypothetical protein